VAFVWSLVGPTAVAWMQQASVTADPTTRSNMPLQPASGAGAFGRFANPRDAARG